MQRFEGPHDPLAKRVSDVELRQVLERLGEAQFGGGERATVGAVVEATGADTATVLRILGEIRMEAIEAQNVAMDGIERRVSELETSTGTARVAVPVKTVEEQRVIAVVLAIVMVIGISAFILTIVGAANTSKPHHPYGESTWTAQTHDGKVEMGPDGTIREATEREKLDVEGFAAFVSTPRTSGQ